LDAVVVPLKAKIPVVVLNVETLTPEGSVAVDLNWSPVEPLEKLCDI
jgi:hypothetical protein